MKNITLISLAPLLVVLTGWVIGDLTIDVDSAEARNLEERNDLMYYHTELLTGQLVKYFDNGELVFRKSYKEGRPHGLWKGFYKNGQLRYRGEYEQGEKIGVWKEYFENGEPLVEFNYSNLGAKPASLTKTNEKNDQIVITDKGSEGDITPVEVPLTPIRVTETMPEPPGGMKAFYGYIANNLTYPKEALEKNIQGIVFLQFVVQTDGSLTDIQVLRGPGGGLNMEGIRLIREYKKKWKPGMKEGEAVPVYYNLPIKFTLQ